VTVNITVNGALELLVEK